MILENGYLEQNVVQQGDCLKLMKFIPDGSIDAVICDPPYGTTACKWDAVIPFEPMWEQLKRVTKNNGAIVLFGSQPFTSALVMSNPEWFKYELVWDKVNLYTNFLNASHQPLRRHENVLVFCKGKTVFNKQYRSGQKYHTQKPSGFGKAYGKQRAHEAKNDGEHHNPCSVIDIKSDLKSEKGFHPTQKPVTLFEYIIKTYTNEGETVLDFTAGSFTAAVACENLKRDWICIEKEKEYCKIGEQRINANREKLKDASKILIFDL